MINYLKNRYNSRKYLIALFLIVSCFTTLYQIHGKVMIEPNSYLLSSEGEGPRVYYVFASHAKTDSLVVSFQGMNYPYGEHMIFCDAQPLLANSFYYLAKVFPNIVNYAVGIQNFISLYGLILGALLLYFFFLGWKITYWYAALASYSMMLISPQVLRMPWQPSLAYFFFIPIILLLFQRYFRQSNLKWTVTISFTILMSYFINPYLGVIGTLFFGLVTLSLLYKNGWTKINYYIYGFTQSLVPGLLYQFYVKLTDTRSDRVDLPDGLHQFTATFTSVFTSPYSPLKEIYTTLGADLQNVYAHFDGMAYLGISSSLLLLFFIIRFCYKKIRATHYQTKITSEQQTLLFVAFVFFIIATGFPFVLHPSLEKLLEFFKPLRQLRSLGRMVWMSAFCINIFVFSQLYFIIKHTRFKISGYVVSILLLLLTAYEGVFLHKEVATHQEKGNIFVKTDLKENSKIAYIEKALNKIDPSNYSAVVPIPFFHVGSELFVTKSHTSYRAMLEVLAFAYHTELPLTACYLSRISVEESKKSLQFFAPSMIKKEISSDIKSKKPLLLFHSKLAPKPSMEEQRLLKLGEIIYETDLISLIEIYPKKIWKTNDSEVFSWFTDYRKEYLKKNNIYYYGDREPIYLSYDNLNDTKGFHGNGFYYKENEQKYFFTQTPNDTILKTGTYDMSFWLENSLNRMQSKLILEKIDKNGNILATEELSEARRSFTIVNNWTRWEHTIELSDEYNIRLSLNQPSNQPELIIDDFLLAPKSSSIFVPIDENNWMWNNYPFTIN